MPLPMTYDRPSQEVVAAAMASELGGKITRPSPRRTKTVWHSSQATAARRSPNNNGTHYASLADSSDPNTTNPYPLAPEHQRCSVAATIHRLLDHAEHWGPTGV